MHPSVFFEKLLSFFSLRICRHWCDMHIICWEFELYSVCYIIMYSLFSCMFTLLMILNSCEMDIQIYFWNLFKKHLENNNQSHSFSFKYTYCFLQNCVYLMQKKVMHCSVYSLLALKLWPQKMLVWAGLNVPQGVLCFIGAHQINTENTVIEELYVEIYWLCEEMLKWECRIRHKISGFMT